MGAGACKDESQGAFELKKPVLAAMCDADGWNGLTVDRVYKELFAQPHSVSLPSDGNSFFDDFWANLVVYLNELLPYLQQHERQDALHAVICCVPQDNSFAESLQQALKSSNLNTKICSSSNQWSEQCTKEASVLLPVISPAFHTSQHMKDVVKTAYELRMRVVPVRLSWPKQDMPQDPFMSRCAMNKGL